MGTSGIFLFADPSLYKERFSVLFFFFFNTGRVFQYRKGFCFGDGFWLLGFRRSREFSRKGCVKGANSWKTGAVRQLVATTRGRQLSISLQALHSRFWNWEATLGKGYNDQRPGIVQEGGTMSSRLRDKDERSAPLPRTAPRVTGPSYDHNEPTNWEAKHDETKGHCSVLDVRHSHSD